MAITATTLAAAVSADDQVIKATSATGATVGGFAKFDNEFAEIIAINGTTIEVRRTGEQGSAVVAHNILAPLVFGLWSDLPELGNTQVVPTPRLRGDLVTVGADAAIACPVRDTVFTIMKATALASSTFANPSAAQDGLVVTFTSGTEAAHVVTFVNLNDGTTGNHTTATFAAFKGCSLTVVAVRGEWNVVAANGVTIT